MTTYAMKFKPVVKEWRKEMSFNDTLKTFIYSYMVKEHIKGFYFRLVAMNLLYAPSHAQDGTNPTIHYNIANTLPLSYVHLPRE